MRSVVYCAAPCVKGTTAETYFVVVRFFSSWSAEHCYSFFVCGLPLVGYYGYCHGDDEYSLGNGNRKKKKIFLGCGGCGKAGQYTHRMSFFFCIGCIVPSKQVSQSVSQC